MFSSSPCADLSNNWSLPLSVKFCLLSCCSYVCWQGARTPVDTPSPFVSWMRARGVKEVGATNDAPLPWDSSFVFVPFAPVALLPSCFECPSWLVPTVLLVFLFETQSVCLFGGTVTLPQRRSRADLKACDCHRCLRSHKIYGKLCQRARSFPQFLSLVYYSSRLSAVRHVGPTVGRVDSSGQL